MEQKEVLMGMVADWADMPHEQILNEVLPALIKMMPDELLNKLHFALFVECQERFVATGDQEPIERYEDIRGE